MKVLHVIVQTLLFRIRSTKCSIRQGIFE